MTRLTHLIVSGAPPQGPRPLTIFEQEAQMAALFGVKLRPPRETLSAREVLHALNA